MKTEEYSSWNKLIERFRFVLIELQPKQRISTSNVLLIEFQRLSFLFD